MVTATGSAALNKHRNEQLRPMLAISWPIESPLVTKDKIRLTLTNSYFSKFSVNTFWYRNIIYRYNFSYLKPHLLTAHTHTGKLKESYVSGKVQFLTGGSWTSPGARDPRKRLISVKCRSQRLQSG